MNFARVLLIVMMGACAQEDLDIEDSVADTFATGKADGDGIVEGSLAAQGVLALVNDARTTVRRLDEEVGLSERVAQGIVNYREEVGRFTSLQVLDDVEHVGPLTFTKLLEYALAHDYVPRPSFEIPERLRNKALAFDGTCTGGTIYKHKSNAYPNRNETKTTSLNGDATARLLATASSTLDYTLAGELAPSWRPDLYQLDNIPADAYRVQLPPSGVIVLRQDEPFHSNVTHPVYGWNGIYQRSVDVAVDDTSFAVTTKLMFDVQKRGGCCSGRYDPPEDYPSNSIGCNAEWCDWTDFTATYECSTHVEWDDL